VIVAAMVPSLAQPVSADESMVHMMGECVGGSCQFSYVPADITLPAGSAITFMNLSSAAHSATADSGAFDTGRMEVGGIVRIEFPNPGTYLYHCTIHPSMHGRVSITTAQPSPVTPSSTAIPPAVPTATSASETATPAPSVTPALPTVTRVPASLALRASFAPRRLHPGQSTTLTIRTGAGAQLVVRLGRPGKKAVQRQGKAGANGAFNLRVGTSIKQQLGKLTARVTARLSAQSATFVTSAVIR
jgi:plastocyanin